MCDDATRRDWRGFTTITVDRPIGDIGTTTTDATVEQCEKCGEYQVRIIDDVPIVNADELNVSS